MTSPDTPQDIASPITELAIDAALQALFDLRDHCVAHNMPHAPVQDALDAVEQWGCNLANRRAALEWGVM